MVRSLTGTMSKSQSGPESNSYDGVLHSYYISRIGVSVSAV